MPTFKVGILILGTRQTALGGFYAILDVLIMEIRANIQEVPSDVVYRRPRISCHGEVAEWSKAAVC
jgi:hypothetical protein